MQLEILLKDSKFLRKLDDTKFEQSKIKTEGVRFIIELTFENGKLFKKTGYTKEREIKKREIKKFKILSIEGICLDKHYSKIANEEALRKKAMSQKNKEANAFVMSDVELLYWRGNYVPYCGVLFSKIPDA